MTVLVVAPSEQPPEPKTISQTQTQAPSPTKKLVSLPLPTSPSLVHGDFPLVQLQGDSIPDTIAASLASSLLGHVLFLKNQVPLPIPQLNRLKPTSAKSAKLKDQLLDAFDTLTSHLDTTFTALSTAFAKRRGRGTSSSRVYLAIMLGPSVGTAKARVLLAVDGLETKVWGERDDLPEEEEEEEEEEEDSDEEDEDDEHPPDSDSDSDSEPEPTHADHQLALRTADRLLSRALVGADADLAAEMNPTQTHVLIRAPRRFVHPAWVPRQNVTASLDRTFLGGKGTGKSKVEGVWVGCRRPAPEEEDDGKDEDEEDEMIWWSWDGKIVGFAGW
ncbi:hypothetical protein BDZ89DRAFT_1157784 [Hymenopellis radicata]|nr:hypothetical protein BDZ89DRAFT_1157784 [Hymenopellis radicata]